MKGIKGFIKGNKLGEKNKGKIHSDIQNNNFSIAMIGRKYSKEVNMKKGRKGNHNGFKKGEQGVWKNKKFSKIHKLNLRIPHPSSLAENHHSWKGGSDKYWKNKALKRDDNICQKCGLKDNEIMIVDHIKPKSIYPELKKELSNLQTLCPNCHARKTVNELKEIMRIKKANI